MSSKTKVITAGDKPSSRRVSAEAPATISLSALAALGALVGAILWSYWPTILDLWEFWDKNEDYSGGKFVPLIAIYLAWSDRNALRRLPLRTCWWGLAIVVGAQVLRLYALLFAFGSIERFSLILSVIGLILLLVGREITWQAKWVLVFLLLMIPVPMRIHNTLALPLQNLATASAAFGLELLGILVVREGNVLRLSEQTTIAVAEACSGLRMLTAFIVVAAVLAFIVRRPVWQKALLVASSIPVAIFANTLRLVATALLYEMASSDLAEHFFHDFAGITMMPVAIGASLALLALMKWVSSSPEPGVKGPV